MINANLEQFLDTGWFNEATLYYEGYIYWCEGGIYHKKNNSFYFSVYRFPAQIINEKYFKRLHSEEPFKYLYEDTGKNEDEVKERFLKAKIFNGKSFWDVEKELAWLDE